MSLLDRLDLPMGLRARIASVTGGHGAPIAVAIRHGQWCEGLEQAIDDAVVATLGGHDGLVIEARAPPADAPDPPPLRADERQFLTSRAWLGLRYRVLKKYGARCQCCGRGAKDGAIIQVDHIKPRSLPQLAARRQPPGAVPRLQSRQGHDRHHRLAAEARGDRGPQVIYISISIFPCDLI